MNAGSRGLPRRARRRATASEATESRDRWLISYADLVTLLFALFIVLYAAADRDRAQRFARAVALQLGNAPAATPAERGGSDSGAPATLAAVHSAIENAFAANGELSTRARYTQTERGLVVSLAEAGFFAPGEARLRPDALPLIDALSEALHDTDAPVRVEGHTDSTPISNTLYPSNWELSAARASNVLARLTSRDVAPSRLSVAGYADERPVADNLTSQGRALNRRVDLVILRARE